MRTFCDGGGEMTFVLHIACEAGIRWIDRERAATRRDE